jgi:hypothetical protein
MISLKRLLACLGYFIRANCGALRAFGGGALVLGLVPGLGFGFCRAAILACPPGEVLIAGSCVPIVEWWSSGGFGDDIIPWKRLGEAWSAPNSIFPEWRSGPSPPGPPSPPSGPSEKPTSPIVENGYEFLYARGSERPGFGLYSYVLLTQSSPERAKAFLRAVFALTPHASAFGADIAQVNVIYIPSTKGTKQGAVVANADDATARYNFDLARALIQSICQAPKIGGGVQSCHGGLSAGPYLFSYASPLGDGAHMAPPALFVDLTGYRPEAFPTIVDAYKAQVKREDISDRKEIDAFSITVLNALETAAAWANPIQHAIGDVIQIVKPESGGNGEAK